MKEYKFPYSGTTIPLTDSQTEFLQTDELTVEGVAVHPYGAIINPKDNDSGLVEIEKNGKTYLIPMSSLIEGDSGDTVSAIDSDNNLVGTAYVGYAVIQDEEANI